MKKDESNNLLRKKEDLGGYSSYTGIDKCHIKWLNLLTNFQIFLIK